MTTPFQEIKEKHLQTLSQYIPIVDRVHGNHHPEFHEVRDIFESIEKKLTEAGSINPELTKEFARLREITNNYAVPGDVCETYEAVYNMLAELDRAYHGE